MGALISAAAGATVGHLLRTLSAKAQQTDSGPANAILPLLGAIAYFLALAFFVKYIFPVFFGADLPIMKKL